MQEHHVRSWPKFFEPISLGQRAHELRRNDRNYEVGDIVHLHEYLPFEARYTKRMQSVRIQSVTSAEAPCAVSDEGLHPDFIIFSIQVLSPVTCL